MRLIVLQAALNLLGNSPLIHTACAHGDAYQCMDAREPLSASVSLLMCMLVHCHKQLMQLSGTCCSASQREAGFTEQEDPVARAFRPVLPAMLHSAFSAGGRTKEVCLLSPFYMTQEASSSVLLVVVCNHDGCPVCDATKHGRFLNGSHLCIPGSR